MSLFEKLYLGTREEARDDLLKLYKNQWFVVLSFLYFANVMKSRLLEEQTEQWQKNYKYALESSDLLFADGIALQLFYRRWPEGRRTQKTPPNLNGTDFNPWFIKEVLKKSNKVHIGVYTLYDEWIGKPKNFVETVHTKFEEYFDHPINFIFQTDYKERMTVPFDTEGYKKSLEKEEYEYRILLMSTGTPAQEIWVEENRKFLEEQWILVINAWGTIDYITGFETRAPQRVVKARVLETPWRIMQNPKKNFKKFAVMFWIVRYRIFVLKKKCKCLSWG